MWSARLLNSSDGVDMTQLNTFESRVDRLELRVDRMTETLATKEDFATFKTEVREDAQAFRAEVRDDMAALRDEIKILHDRLNSQNIVILTGFIITIASVVITRLLS